MQSITLQQAQVVSGSGYLDGFIISKMLDYVCREVMAGRVDYAGVAASQGTYYNTVGA